MESSWLFFNIDEMLYRIHLYIVEPIWSFLTFGWLFRDSAAARAVEEGALGVTSDAGFLDRWFLSPIYRIFSSRPSAEHDSIQEYLNPADERGILEIIRGILLGTGDKESVLSIILGSFLFWIIIIGLVLWFLKKNLYDRIHFMEKKHALLYNMAHTGHVQKNANDKAVRWQRITEQANSNDVTAWKIAVMDADILLDEVLGEQGFAGETVAEKLADARTHQELTTTEYAAEAHGVRNRIAHDSGYVLEARQARSTIAMYERFFNELYHL